jgi:Co/Zn/Cd efflux system component
MITNVGVLLAAAGSYLLAAHWPDIIDIIASMFLCSAPDVLWQSIRALRADPPRPPRR